MSKIKVLHLIYSLEIGGAERVVVAYAKGLNKDLFNIIVCSFKNGPLSEELNANKIPCIILDKKKVFDLKCLFKLITILKGHNIDLLHTHNFSPNFWGRILAFFLGIKVISTEHTIASAKNLFQKCCDIILKYKTDIIIAVSESVKNSHIEEEAISAKQIITVYNGISIPQVAYEELSDKKTKLGLNNNIPVGIAVGRLEKPKGYEFLLNALVEVLAILPDFQMLIVGEGSLRTPLEEQAQHLGIRRNVKFTGFRSDRQDLIALSTIFINSSLWEGLPISILEAMALEKPIIATNVGGNPEAIIHNKTGYLVPEKNPHALTNSILFFLQHKDNALKLGKNAKIYYLKNFTEQIMLNKTEALYSKILERK